MLFIAYLTWDPSPSLFDFSLPLLHRPILWYGFLFALGFFLGYLVLTYLLRRYFLFFREFRQEDVLCWPELVKRLAERSLSVAKAVAVHLSPADQQWCKGWKIGDEIPGKIKHAIVAAMNRALNDPDVVLEATLPPLSRRLCAFAVKRGVATRKSLQMREALHLLSIKAKTAKCAEQITFYVIIGAVVGSRLGDVLFYQNWAEIVRHPFSIVEVWQGGLASHGGAAGILVAVWLFSKRRKIPFWTAVDFCVIPTAIAAVCIRAGNFFNQEILGTPTRLPWGILFLHPADGGPIVPRHPAQLYEALWYLCTFALLLIYWHRRLPFEQKGRLAGLFLILVFGFRFLIEFLKVEQSALLSPHALLTMGQWLSVPFFLLGAWLFFRRQP